LACQHFISEYACEPLGEKEDKAVCMLTYSDANLDLFPSREDFALAVIRSLSNGTEKFFSGPVVVRNIKIPESITT